MEYKTTQAAKICNKEVVLDMESDSKNSVNSVQKVAILFGVIFCTVVTVVLVVLYYPADSVEKEFDDDFNKMTPVSSFKDWNTINTGGEETSRTRVEDVAKALEDFGAAFLALVAVCCVAVGLTCLFCACCILK